MTAELKTVIYPTKDLAAAKASFAAVLGTDPVADSEYYVGFQAGDVQIGLDPSGHHGATGAVPYLSVDDMEAAIESLTQAGGTVKVEPTEVGGGRRTAIVVSPGDLWIGLIHDA